MEIITAYKTSRGIFLNQTEALAKKNRAVEWPSRPGDPHDLEAVVPVFLIAHDGKFFELAQVQPK